MPLGGGIHSAFHPASSLLATNGWEARLQIWDSVLGRRLFNVPSLDSSNLKFNRDGHIFLTDQRQLIEHRVEPALEYRTLTHASAHAEGYGRVSVRKDQRIAATASDPGILALGTWPLVPSSRSCRLARPLTHSSRNPAICSRFQGIHWECTGGPFILI